MSWKLAPAGTGRDLSVLKVKSSLVRRFKIQNPKFLNRKSFIFPQIPLQTMRRNVLKSLFSLHP